MTPGFIILFCVRWKGFLVSCQVGSYKKITQPTVDGSEIRLTTWDAFETLQIMGYLPYQLVGRISSIHSIAKKCFLKI